ncbi:MAG: tetratricopeptide repeat protein, partial [Candidatus Omnitrophica bacterium]|nr:tetratricopeptide repeat protein [Candidatus Omnitrophota bacterium]
MIFVLIGVLFLSISSVYAETVEEYFNRGLAHGNQGNFPQAISDFTKAIEINPNDAEAYYNRGLVYGTQGNFPQAISDFTKAIEINPNDAEAYYNRGLAYYEKKEYDSSWA